MVEFGGNLVPIEVAERRSYFSAFLQVESAGGNVGV
jgi:hypothetical protein